METTQEKVYYEDEQVKVTNKRFIVGAKTYAMKNISSVGVGEREPSTFFPVVLLIIGAVVGIGGGSGENYVIMFVGIVFAIIGFGMIASNKTEYAVKISSNSGETKGLISKDRSYIEKVVNAVNDAIVE